MKGVTNVLRLLFGIPLGTDHESEFLTIGAERVHLFDAFALVNYLLCSAIGTDGKQRGMATRTMKKNCAIHFREVMRILEPSVVVVQGKGFWRHVRKAFDSVEQDAGCVFRARSGTTETLVAALTHPSAHGRHNWGVNDHTEYLLGTVAPTVARIREHLGRR
jgi:uracil-DNA glycosylase